MDAEEEEITVVGPSDVQGKFKKFQHEVSTHAPHLKGKFLLETLPYNPLSIDPQNRKNWPTRFLTQTFTLSFSQSPAYQRSFLLYLPSTLKQNMQLIVLLHGTGQTIFDTELVCQVEDAKGEGTRRYGWMEVAEGRGVGVVVPQSRGLRYRGKVYYGWQPGNEDLVYLMQILDKITAYNYYKQTKLPKFSLSPKNISIIGFSNGGLFTSDLYIHYTTSQPPKPHIKIFINFMGGIESSLSNMETLKFDPQLKKTPIYIMSCKRDQNYGPCLRAKQFFQAHFCNVNFIDVGGFKHQFRYGSVRLIEEYISRE